MGKKKDSKIVADNVNETKNETIKEEEKMSENTEETKVEATETNETNDSKTNEELEPKQVMAGKCSHCGKDVATANSCDHRLIKIESKWYERVAVPSTSGARCDSCGINWKKGNIHHYGCANEACPVCGGMLNDCDCGKQEVALLLRVKRLVNESTMVAVPARICCQEIEDFMFGIGFGVYQVEESGDTKFIGSMKVKDVTKKLKREFGKISEKMRVYTE